MEVLLSGDLTAFDIFGLALVGILDGYYPNLEPAQIKYHKIGEQPLPLDTVLVNARVQARLSSINTRAKLAPSCATRKQRNDPSLDST